MESFFFFFVPSELKRGIQNQSDHISVYACCRVLSAVNCKKDSIWYNRDRIYELAVNANRWGHETAKLYCPQRIALAAISLFGLRCTKL